MAEQDGEHVTHWNYRVTRLTEEDYYVFEIREFYYEADGETPLCWSVHPINPFGEDLEELKHDLGYMIQALDHPVFDLDTGSWVIEMEIEEEK